MYIWKNLCESRCAIDSLYDWINQDLTDAKLLKILRGLGFHKESDFINKYIYKYNHHLLIQNIKKAFKRHKV